MTSTLVPTDRGGFTQSAFDTFLSTRDEPAWLTELRRSAWRRFQELPMPSVRDEEWMRTDVRLFKFDKFNLPEPDGEAASSIDVPHALLAAGVDLGGRAVSMNSHSVAAELDPPLAAKGVLFGSLAKLVREHGDLLRPFFERRVVDPFKDKFSALNAACWSGGTLLYVPKNVRIELPLHSLSAMAASGVDFGKTLIVVEPGAEATVLNETASATLESAGLHCGSIELIV
jgi:Fe-S cluster assembly protein SufD